MSSMLKSKCALITILTVLEFQKTGYVHLLWLMRKIQHIL